MIEKNQLPESGFYAVVFSSAKGNDLEGYKEMDEKTMQLSSKVDGFLGYESLSNENKSIFISYWRSKDAIQTWRENATHLLAKSNSKQWYTRYLSQICYVESNRCFEINQ